MVRTYSSAQHTASRPVGCLQISKDGTTQQLQQIARFVFSVFAQKRAYHFGHGHNGRVVSLNSSTALNGAHYLSVTQPHAAHQRNKVFKAYFSLCYVVM